MMQQATRSGHQQGCVHALARHIGKVEIDQAILALEKVIKITGHLVGRNIHSAYREIGDVRFG